MLITVFTPAYNRAHLLQRLYDSLCSQTFNDFEWLIVDDGSKDNTEDVSQCFHRRR
jgi:glycosyltransferase involved in cell wall biosynthesis